MPSSAPNSSASPEPSATPSEGAERGTPWRANVVLFLVTLVGVFLTQVFSDRAAADAMKAAKEAGSVAPVLAAFGARPAIVHGLEFTASLMTILLAHELAHYVAARIHKVDASLPYFIP